MANPRPRPSVMTLTERAASRIHEIVEASDKPIAGLRVGVKNAGCAGMAYTLDPVETPNAADDVVSDHGVTVYIDLDRDDVYDVGEPTTVSGIDGKRSMRMRGGSRWVEAGAEGPGAAVGGPQAGAVGGLRRDQDGSQTTVKNFAGSAATSA